MRRGEVWASNAREHPLENYFTHMFEEIGLWDVMPKNNSPNLDEL